jgi:competence ComEA-like helix-hairpin-helix protein
MTRVTGALATAMCIPLLSQEPTSQEQENKELTALKAECEMWKRCYDVAMTQLVDLKVNSDLALRMARAGYGYEESEETEEFEEAEEPVVVVPEPPKEPESPKVEETERVENESERVEINTCSAEDLKRCGCNPDLIQTIMGGRPYMVLDDLRKVNGVTSVAYGLLKHKLYCVPVKVEEPKVEEPEQKIEEPEVVVEQEAPVEPLEEKPVVVLDDTSTFMSPPEKVNVNTATAKEIKEKLGISDCYAYSITGYRKKNGFFVDLEELRDIKVLPKSFLDNYKDRLTIGESEEKQPVVEESAAEELTEEPVEGIESLGGKVNVNTATAEEIFKRTGLNIYTAKNIVAYRKKNGPFRDLASLVLVNRFGPGCLKAYGDMLTVGDPEPEQEQESDKVNINTASMRELMEVGFEKRAAALIVNERKKFGRFRDLDDLAKIPEISGRILRKLRDNLEV